MPGKTASGAALAPRQRCRGLLSRPRGLGCHRVAEEGLHYACLKCILCGLEGDLSYFEEELGLLMVSVVRAAWALIIGHPRVAVIIYAPAMLWS